MGRSDGMKRRLRERPWTPEQNAKRSAAQKGKPKSPETRAAMHASRSCGPARTPEWERAYRDYLAHLRLEGKWAPVMAHAVMLGLKPRDAYRALDIAGRRKQNGPKT